MKIILALIGLLISSTFLFVGTSAQTTNLPNNFGTIVYESANRYYVKDSNDNIIIGNNTPDIVIKTALDRGGDIYIAKGTYNLSPNFSGFDIKSNTYLRIALDAYIVVPSGYGGHVFRFNTGTYQSVMDGGNIKEASPVKRNWIGILMQGTHVYFNLIENTVITNPLIVIDFNGTSSDWINANTFFNIKGWSFVRGIEFDFQGTPVGGGGFSSNVFRDLQFESSYAIATYGVKDIKHSRESFYNVLFWDLPANAISSTIDPSADSTIIIGGEMTDQNFQDNGHNTIILDAWHTNLISDSTILLAILNSTYHPQMNVQTQQTLQTHQVLNMRILSQNVGDFVKGNYGQLTILTGPPTSVNIYGTVNHPKGGSIRLDITRPDGVVEQNQAGVTSDGAFYFPMNFDKNSLTGQYNIDGSYQNANLGSLVLNVTSDLLPHETNSNPNIGMTSPLGFNTILSAKVKNDARLWSQDKISDDVFVSNIQYLVKMGIIVKPTESQPALSQSTLIPAWLKNNAAWWADGQISDSDFISVIQYLLNNGIIRMS